MNSSCPFWASIRNFVRNVPYICCSLLRQQVTVQLSIRVKNLEFCSLSLDHNLKMWYFAVAHWGFVMGGLTTISLGALIVFHIVFGLGNLLKVFLRSLRNFQRILVAIDLSSGSALWPFIEFGRWRNPRKGRHTNWEVTGGCFCLLVKHD